VKSPKLTSPDWSLGIVVLFLMVIGMIMMFSTTSVTGLSQYGDAYYFVKKHGIFLLVGLGLFVLGIRIPHQVYKEYAFQGFFFGVFLLLLTLFPVLGVKVGGAQRWLNLGAFYLQPVEIMKFFIAVFLSVSLANKQTEIKDFMKSVGPILLMLMVPIMILAKQPDLGNIILILLVTFSLLFLAETPLSHMFALLSSGLVLIATSIMLYPYQLRRIKSFLDPWKDPLGQNYHIIQSFIAIGSGGFLGHGIGQSKLKYFYLPLHYSDFVFSILCEEGGWIFAVIVLGLFGALLYRGCFIAVKAPTQYAYFLALAITFFLVFQALLNIGVVIGVFPVTGIPLTFISYGGSSYVMSLFLVGVLLNISRSRA
jgi:cell division protein FtsW